MQRHSHFDLGLINKWLQAAAEDDQEIYESYRCIHVHTNFVPMKG